MTDTRLPDDERVAYCQNCGRPLSATGVRNVGSAIYCEPCLVAKVAAADASGATAGSAAGGYGFSGSSSGVNYSFQGAMPPPPPPPVSGAPNPGLAALLGFIPGVGAFYNGQYAKGVVHLVVFAILTTLSDHNGIFGLFIAGWVFYQVIEAHHTARARRDGTPLPNPFGLNDIGERLGFGRAWPGAATTGGQAGAGSPTSGFGGSSSGFAGEAGRADPAGAGSAYAPPPAAAYVPPHASYGSYPPPAASWGAPAETYASAPPPFRPPDIGSTSASGNWSRVPVGAIFLIALGVLFLVGNSDWFNGVAIYKLIPFLLIGVGVWIFVRKMVENGGLADEGTPAYRLRLFHAARGPVWIVLVGVLFLLDTFHLLSWGRSWPLFIIVGGVMTFFERTVYAAVAPAQYAYVPPGVPVTPETPSAAATGVVSSSSQDREGN